MRRVLPAHVLVASSAVGLAAGNALRLDSAAQAAAAAGIVVAALVLAPAGQLSMSAGLALAAAAACLLGWGWSTVRLDALDRSELRADIGRSGRALIEITGEARVGAYQLRIPGRIRRFEGRAVSERVQLELALGRSPPQGALVSALVVVREPRSAEHGFDERRWLRRQGIHVVLTVDEWAVVGRRGELGGLSDRLRRWLRRDAVPGLSGERRAVIGGVVLGDDAALSSALQTSFRRSGLYHLLAVSGQNVVLLAAGVLGLAWLFGVPRAAAHVGAVFAIGAYVLAVGPQPSVIRAAVSGWAVSVAWLLGRDRDPWHVLLLAAVVLLAWNPYVVFDAGFQLSFAAVCAIFLLAPRLTTALEGYPVPRRLACALAISCACSAVTAPILWLQFGRVPLLGVLANALVEPVVGVLLGVALLTAVVQPVLPSLAGLLACANGWVAVYLAACARAVGAVSFAQVSGAAAAAAALAVTVGVAAYAWRQWRTS